MCGFLCFCVLLCVDSLHAKIRTHTQEEHFEQIKEAVVEMDGSMWDDVSEGAKDLISQLLVKDPAKRWVDGWLDK